MTTEFSNMQITGILKAKSSFRGVVGKSILQQLSQDRRVGDTAYGQVFQGGLTGKVGPMNGKRVEGGSGVWG